MKPSKRDNDDDDDDSGGLKSLILRGVVALNSRGHSAGTNAGICDQSHLSKDIFIFARPPPFFAARVFHRDTFGLTILSVQVRSRAREIIISLSLFFDVVTTLSALLHFVRRINRSERKQEEARARIWQGGLLPATVRPSQRKPLLFRHLLQPPFEAPRGTEFLSRRSVTGGFNGTTAKKVKSSLRGERLNSSRDSPFDSINSRHGTITRRITLLTIDVK